LIALADDIKALYGGAEHGETFRQAAEEIEAAFREFTV
jgi:hypothetical protein